MISFHGTSLPAVQSITETGLKVGSYVSDDFEFAASYALRNGHPAVVALDCPVSRLPEDEESYDSERVSTGAGAVLATYQYDGEIPADWYELDDGLERKYPELFDKNNWRAKCQE